MTINCGLPLCGSESGLSCPSPGTLSLGRSSVSTVATIYSILELMAAMTKVSGHVIIVLTCFGYIEPGPFLSRLSKNNTYPNGIACNHELCFNLPRSTDVRAVFHHFQHSLQKC